MILRYREEELPSVVRQLIPNLTSKNLCLYGDMGAGKTTLTKALVKELGGADIGHSPTFGIVNEYLLKSGNLLGYHFDFYRLDNEIEALDMGFEEYLDQNVWVFIEWPEKIASLLPENTTPIRIKIIDATTRELEI